MLLPNVPNFGRICYNVDENFVRVQLTFWTLQNQLVLSECNDHETNSVNNKSKQ